MDQGGPGIEAGGRLMRGIKSGVIKIEAIETAINGVLKNA